VAAVGCEASTVAARAIVPSGASRGPVSSANRTRSVWPTGQTWIGTRWLRARAAAARMSPPVARPSDRSTICAPAGARASARSTAAPMSVPNDENAPPLGISPAPGHCETWDPSANEITPTSPPRARTEEVSSGRAFVASSPTLADRSTRKRTVSPVWRTATSGPARARARRASVTARPRRARRRRERMSTATAGTSPARAHGVRKRIRPPSAAPGPTRQRGRGKPPPRPTARR